MSVTSAREYLGKRWLRAGGSTSPSLAVAQSVMKYCLYILVINDIIHNKYIGDQESQI